MNITFDSNVWERVVNEESHHFIKIKNKIRIGEIRAYICEIALSLEAIQKKMRAEFFENYEPTIIVENIPTEDHTFHMRVCVKPNTELHPGLHPKQRAKLLEARDLGFRVLRMTNFGTVRTTEIPDDMYVQHTNTEDFWRYADLLESCSDYITGLGCGQTAYNQFKEEFNQDGWDDRTMPVKHKKKLAKAIAEWTDGNSLSAHYAAGNDFFLQTTKLGTRVLDPYLVFKIEPI